MLNDLFNIAAQGYGIGKIVGLANEADPVEAVMSAPSQGAGWGNTASGAKGMSL